MQDWLMLCLLRLLPVLAIRLFRSRRELLLENLALRQQLTVLKQRHPQPRFATPDKLFWVMLRRLWYGMEMCVGSRAAGDGCPLASYRIQVVLEVALAAKPPHLLFWSVSCHYEELVTSVQKMDDDKSY
jgi:hypothetical protein